MWYGKSLGDFGLSQYCDHHWGVKVLLPQAAATACADYHMHFSGPHIHVEQEGCREEQHEFSGLAKAAKTMSSLVKKWLTCEPAPSSLQMPERCEHCREGTEQEKKSVETINMWSAIQIDLGDNRDNLPKCARMVWDCKTEGTEKQPR